MFFTLLLDQLARLVRAGASGQGTPAETALAARLIPPARLPAWAETVAGDPARQGRRGGPQPRPQGADHAHVRPDRGGEPWVTGTGLQSTRAAVARRGRIAPALVSCRCRSTLRGRHASGYSASVPARQHLAVAARASGGSRAADAGGLGDGRHKITARTIVGDVQAGFRVRHGTSPVYPVLICHHGLA